MIKREQIPTAAIAGMKKSHRWSDFWSDDEAKDLVAAAINAWPGMHCSEAHVPGWNVHIELPLLEEEAND